MKRTRKSQRPARSSPTLDLDRQNHFRQRYATRCPGWRASGQVYEATVRQYVHPHARILDIGCGRGGLVELLHDRVALAAGVDPDLCSLLEHRMPDVRRVSGLAERLPFADESFDLVTCSWVLEHLVRPSRAFSEVARVLHCAGHFIFLTPNAWHPLIWASRLVGRSGDWQARLVARLYGRAEADTFPVVYGANTRQRLVRLATAAGLKPLALSGIGDPTYLAFNELAYHVATVAERLTPEWMKIHLVGDFVKEGAQ